MTNQAFEPKNEQGTIVNFAQRCIGTKWSIVEIRIQYPDAVLECDGEQWLVEFEFMSSNFADHRHDARKCDLIVCWKHDYVDCPLPVMSLDNDDWKTAVFQKPDPKDLEIDFWKNKAISLQRKINVLELNAQTGSSFVDSEPDGTPKAQKLIAMPDHVLAYIEDNKVLQLPLHRELTEGEKMSLCKAYEHYGSKNKTCEFVFGYKSPKSLSRLDDALGYNSQQLEVLEN